MTWPRLSITPASVYSQRLAGDFPMAANTAPNAVYIARQQARRGFVDKVAWSAVVNNTGSAKQLSNASEARAAFDRARERYWVERWKLAVAGEFNPYNQARMRSGKAPIGPDGFPMELEHREELSMNPARALDPDNIWEIFKRQHDFQHGNYAFRWHAGSFPQSPHIAGLSQQFGNPLDYQYWP
jgi:hypothetical protein